MPVSTSMIAPTDPPTAHLSQPTSCVNCRECGTRVLVGGSPVLYWPVQLDRDLLQTISTLFPNWFKDCNLNDMSKMPESPRKGVTGGAGGSNSFIPLSPPKCEVDDSPLLGKTLNKNKESLKVKLMLRRPREDLINRGVIPPMNTPMAFYEQRQRLDMAKKHDILKHKMQRRPLREELVRQHILEDSPGNIDPSLVEKQKQLKRARIADTINDHLCQRPGPLELVKANILHTTEDLEKAVKEGQLMFKSTSEGEPRKHPSLYISYDDESSSEGGMSPEQSEGGSGRASSTPTSGAIPASTSLSVPAPQVPAVPVVSSTHFTTVPSTLSAAIVAASLPTGAEIPPSPSLPSTASSLSPLSSLASPSHSFLSSPQALLVTQTTLPHALTTPPLQSSAPGKDQSKSRKKAKGKTTPKTRTIKFHEYKGPPSAVKREHSSPTETSYDILLQQQQLFLQCQLELKQKYTQIILPAALKGSSNDFAPGVTLSSVLTLASTPPPISVSAASATLPISHTGNPPIAPAPPNHSSTPPAPPPPPTPPELSTKLPTKLEDLKVSDLKLELKKRNLPVSGSKPQLIERLRFHSKTSFSCNSSSKPSCSSISSATGSQTAVAVATSSGSETPLISKVSRSSIDITDDASVAGFFESSMEVGEDSVLSPYSHISTQPSSVAPMDVDLEAAIEESDLRSVTPLNPPPAAPGSSEGGSINTPPPPPPPPPPPLPSVPFVPPAVSTVSLSTSSASSPPPKQTSASSTLTENQDGILQLKRKIDDLQRELINTQMQLQHQQKQNMLKAKDNYQKNIYDPKFNQKAILQHQIDSRKHQQQQQQLQTHLLQLQKNLQNEQKQLKKNSDNDAAKEFEDLILIHTNNVNNNSQFKGEEKTHPKQQFIGAQQYHQPQQRLQQQQQQLRLQRVLDQQQQQQERSQQEQLQQEQLQHEQHQHEQLQHNQHHHEQPQHKQRQENSKTEPITHFSLPCLDGQPKGNIFQIGDFHIKVEGRQCGPPEQKSQRSGSILVPNGIIINTHHRTSSLPNFSGLIVTNGSVPEGVVDAHERSCQPTTSQAGESVVESPVGGEGIPERFHIQPEFNMKPPPNYSEATRHSKAAEQIQQQQTTIEPARKTSYKSQQVDDVLEILIKNGELPPSAAQDPITPTTPHKNNEPPLFLPFEAAPSIPPPPPPPPPPSSSQKHGVIPSPPTSWVPPPSFPTLSSPSLFADLVMESGSPSNFDLPLDLDLPVFDGVEMGGIGPAAPEFFRVDGRGDAKGNGTPLNDMKMEVGEDVDVASWLDSLAPPPAPPMKHAHIWSDTPSSHALYKGTESATSSGVSSMRSSSSASSSASSSSCGLNLNQSDPLLGSNPDQMDLFCIDDVDLLRPHHTASSIAWDRVDFPT